MIGLCHFCLTSGVEIFVNKQQIRCAKCINHPDVRNMLDMPDYSPLLEFENLPTGSEEQRRKALEMIVDEIYEKSFVLYCKNERISEPLINRLEDT